FNVVYNFGGFMPPIKPDGSGVYKQGSTIPVKFQLKDANGAFITNAVANLFVAKASSGIEGTQVVALSTSKADAGNQFRYDAIANQYIFNIGTSAMTVGTWQLQAKLNDGKMYVVDVSMKK
ncbi:MAG: PxKF domain-containing protein, partial [Patescibacteria group bacterium]